MGSNVITVIIITWLLLSAFAGGLTSVRGRGFAIGFWTSFFFSPLIGFIVGAILSPSEEVKVKEALQTGELKKCPKCAELIKSEAVRCRFCGNEDFQTTK